jgi:hypothetical protein
MAPTTRARVVPACSLLACMTSESHCPHCIQVPSDTMLVPLGTRKHATVRRPETEKQHVPSEHVSSCLMQGVTGVRGVACAHNLIEYDSDSLLYPYRLLQGGVLKELGPQQHTQRVLHGLTGPRMRRLRCWKMRAFSTALEDAFLLTRANRQMKDTSAVMILSRCDDMLVKW